jgi:hypothetical protein
MYRFFLIFLFSLHLTTALSQANVDTARSAEDLIKREFLQGGVEIKNNDYPYLYLNSFLLLTAATNILPNRASPKYLRLNL